MDLKCLLVLSSCAGGESYRHLQTRKSTPNNCFYFSPDLPLFLPHEFVSFSWFRLSLLILRLFITWWLGGRLKSVVGHERKNGGAGLRLSLFVGCCDADSVMEAVTGKREEDGLGCQW